MTVSAADLLVLAKDLRGSSSEASLRGSISRAYYAAFHQADSWHATLPSAGNPPNKSGGKHHDLACRLISPTLPTTDQRHKLSVSAGYILRDAHRMRIKADYSLNETVMSSETDQLIISAEKIIATLV